MTHAPSPPLHFAEAQVALVFDQYPEPLRGRLLSLRALIFDVAARTEGVGPLHETLKWGQPSYLTQSSRSGTTVRIDGVKNEPEQYALFVHCQTGLVALYRTLYPNTFRYGGTRSLTFDVAQTPPQAELRHCIALALTYHLHQKKT